MRIPKKLRTMAEEYLDAGFKQQKLLWEPYTAACKKAGIDNLFAITDQILKVRRARAKAASEKKERETRLKQRPIVAAMISAHKDGLLATGLIDAFLMGMSAVAPDTRITIKVR